jgi:uncharacterized protein (DUF2249 family)
MLDTWAVGRRRYHVVMASPATSHRESRPVPAMLSAHTPRAIRDALVGAERVEFERRYAEEMATAGQTLDLTAVLAVLDTYRKIADITQRQGADAHLRMLDQVARLEDGQEVTTVSGHRHKVEIRW